MASTQAGPSTAELLRSPTEESCASFSNEEAQGLSEGEAFMNVMKVALGAGVFSLPLVFWEAGWGVSAVAAAVLAWLSSATMGMLVASERRVSTMEDRVRLSYAEVVAAAYDGVLPAAWTQLCVEWLIVVGCLVVCAAFMAFISVTIAQDLSQSQPVVLLAAAAVELGLCQVRSFRLLSCTSVVGNAATVCGCVVVIAHGLRVSDGIPRWPPAPVASLSRVPAILGPIAFNFAVHFSLFPIFHAMAQPRSFPRVTSRAFSVLAMLNVAFALACGAVYGDKLTPNIIDALEPGDNLVDAIATRTVKWLISVSLLCSVPLVLASAREIVEATISRWVGSPDRPVAHGTGFVSTAVRGALVLVISLVVWRMPDFGALVTLAGGVAAASCGFVLPPLVHLRTHGLWITPASRALHITASVLGLAIMTISIVVAVADIMSGS